MVKKLSVLALAGLISMPSLALAGGSEIGELEMKINALSEQLKELKAVMAEQAKESKETKKQVTDIENTVIDLDYRADDWDLASRIKFSGDFRTRFDYYNADSVGSKEYSNDSLWTNRFRLNISTKATENIEFKGRLAMYKAWGMQSGFDDDSGSMWPDFDGNATRTQLSIVLKIRLTVMPNVRTSSPVMVSNQRSE